MDYREKFKITKNRFQAGFAVIVVVLAAVRLIFPSVAYDRTAATGETASGMEGGEAADSVATADGSNAIGDADKHRWQASAQQGFPLTAFFDMEGKAVKNKINSVPGYSRTFPDNNDVQLIAASTYGVKPVEDRNDAEHRKKELVFVGASPYYHVDPLKSSIPYLVPRAAILLNDIGRAYYDSLQIKGIPLHQMIVTSVLRTRADVRKLRGHNMNATENSCHLYGTTFDICYNRYKTVSPSADSKRRAVRNDTLKWVLSEVLRDMREAKRCYVKYEVKQGCFHITTR